MVANLRHPDLRPRDIKRIMARKSLDVRWDAGTSAGSEWIYASLEDAAHRQVLLDWLQSKSISASAEALIMGYDCEGRRVITWGDILREPGLVFNSREIMVVSKDLDWRLDYRLGSVARFGRWSQAAQETSAVLSQPP
jgi:hypothetical protein